MSTATRMLERILGDFAALGAQGPVPANAARLFELRGLPDAHDEQWRYANLRALDAIVDFKPTDSRQLAGGHLADGQLADRLLPAPLPEHPRLVIVDGRLDAALSADLAQLAALGVRVTRTSGATRDSSLQASWQASSAQPATATGLDLLHQMFARETLAIECTGAAKLELCFVSTAGAAAYPTLQLELLAGATLQLVERHLGGSGPQLVAAQFQLQLQPAATLWHYRLQEYGNQLVFFDSYTATLARDARLTLCQIGAGAGTARHSAHIALAGERAELHWQALAVANQRQVNDTWVQVEHLARNTVTQQRFRGIAADQARVACSAELQVPAAGAGARLQQTLRGLIDGRGAEVDLRPRLEIRTDDIKASHGATTGQLDENLLFYLLSRGIDPATARTLLKWAFLGDVLGEIQIPALRQAAEHAAAGHLADLLATGALTTGSARFEDQSEHLSDDKSGAGAQA